MTDRGRGRGKKQASKASRRKGPPLPAAAPLPHSDDKEEPPSRSGSPVTAKKPRKDCRITDPGVEDELVEWFRENDSHTRRELLIVTRPVDRVSLQPRLSTRHQRL